MSNTEEDLAMESSNSQSGPGTPMPPSAPSTPMASNPGTPRSAVVESEYRNTPPPTTTPAAAASSGIPQQQVRNTPPPSHSVYTSGASAPASITNQSAQRPIPQPTQPQSKYTQLLAVIEDMGRDIRPTYSGSRTSVERLKRGIVHARILVRECLMECERAART